MSNIKEKTKIFSYFEIFIYIQSNLYISLHICPYKHNLIDNDVKFKLTNNKSGSLYENGCRNDNSDKIKYTAKIHNWN